MTHAPGATMTDLVSPFVVTCEHASNAVPKDGPSLGVPRPLLQSHSAWDPGARDVAQQLALRLNGALELGRYTRLLVDLNRSAHNREAVVPAVCYGVDVPGNQGLTEQQREERIRNYHHPYREAVGAHVARSIDRFGRCVMISVHSFTPALDPDNRRFDVGVMYDPSMPWEEAAVDRLEHSLAAHGRSSERNRPYDGQADSVLSGFRSKWPGPAFLGIELEINQALINGHDWITPLTDALVEGLLEPRIH
jgi:predicted N-formylglutamate amidohydrolase